jgi:hypothetical protein
MPSDNNDGHFLDATVNADGILELSIIGNTTSADHGEELVAWASKTKALLAEMRKGHSGVAKTLVDLGGGGTFDEGTIKLLTELAAAPESVGVSTAVYAGNTFTKMALRTVIAYAGRKEIKYFDTKEEAVAWLNAQ